MTIHHHPSDDLLLDYASGSLGEAWSLAIATHAAVCPVCRQSLLIMESVGGSLLDSIEPEPIPENAFEKLLERLDGAAEEIDERPQEVVVGNDSKTVLPQPLREYLGSDIDGLQWKRLGLGAYQVLIPTGQKGVTARLLRIPEGRAVPEHSHGGLELTLLLAGAFSDSTGLYGRGDFQAADENLRHHPQAARGEDCICLAITDAPLQFSSRAVRMVQPWLHI